MDALRRELSAGLRPVHETFVALIRLFGSRGRATRGLEILAAMENFNYDIRQAWIILIGISLTLSYPFQLLLLYLLLLLYFISFRF